MRRSAAIAVLVAALLAAIGAFAAAFLSLRIDACLPGAAGPLLVWRRADLDLVLGLFYAGVAGFPSAGLLLCLAGFPLRLPWRLRLLPFSVSVAQLVPILVSSLDPWAATIGGAVVFAAGLNFWRVFVATGRPPRAPAFLGGAFLLFCLLARPVAQALPIAHRASLRIAECAFSSYPGLQLFSATSATLMLTAAFYASWALDRQLRPVVTALFARPIRTEGVDAV